MNPRALTLVCVALAASAPACRGRAPVVAAPPATALASKLEPAHASPHLLALARPTPSQALPADRGAAGLHLRLLKLRAPFSVLFVTAHPDDEQAGTLTALSRGAGVRTALLALTRGESGANAMGAEVFDALGLVRSEELLRAARHYGLDDLYLGALFDFGYSKRKEEAFEKWDRQAAVGEVVRAMRINRPDVVIARYQGIAADGHGHHMAAGAVTREAFALAGDPTKFPEQLAEGLRPWQPARLFVAANDGEPASVQVETERFDPWIGETYRALGWRGWSLQRTQTAGRGREVAGRPVTRFRQVAGADGQATSAAETKPGDENPEAGSTGNASIAAGSTGSASPVAGSFFEDLRAPVPEALQAAAEAAYAAFEPARPTAVVPALVEALRLARTARADAERASEADRAFVLAIKERQVVAALELALGLELEALALPPGASDPDFPFAALPTLGWVTPGQRFAVRATLRNRSGAALALRGLALQAPAGWKVAGGAAGKGPLASAAHVATFEVEVAADAQPERPYFLREDFTDARYRVREPALRDLPVTPPPLFAAATVEVSGMPLELRVPVERREEVFPDGYLLQPLAVAPRLSVSLTPARAFLSRQKASLAVQVLLRNDADRELAGEMTLRLPAGWSVAPQGAGPRAQSAASPPKGELAAPAAEAIPFALAPGEVRRLEVTVEVPAGGEDGAEIEAIARVDGAEYREGFERVGYRGLPAHLLPAPARARVLRVPYEAPKGLKVGYVMGAGDELPAAVAQLGARVTLLGERELATAPLESFDTIVIGVRAYAVRPDLRAQNRRLHDYARAGGNLVVLYQTPEFDPGRDAPVPAVMPADPEETCEESAPVEFLAPAHPLLRWPNRLTPADFEGWVEQRGAKFLSSWDPAYTPLLSTRDAEQPPQFGVWLTARVGKGNYTYCALALHRQLPQAVPGAVRLWANLLALGKAPPPVWAELGTK